MCRVATRRFQPIKVKIEVDPLGRNDDSGIFNIRNDGGDRVFHLRTRMAFSDTLQMLKRKIRSSLGLPPHRSIVISGVLDGPKQQCKRLHIFS